MQELGLSAVLVVSAIYVVPGTFLLSLALTRVARRVSPRIGLTDRPDGHRKLHGGSTPLGGGVAVFLATTLVISGLVVASTPWAGELRGDALHQIGLLLAGALLVVVGLIDDWKGMRGRHKLLAQLFVACLVVASGVVIRRVELLGWSVDFGVFAYPITVFWIAGAINSLNLLDGIDGLAGTIGVVLSVTIGILAAVNGNYTVTVVAWAFASALLGFLAFNLPPASIFLGDAGSMLIGLVVGTLAIRGSLVGSGTALLTAPLAIWSVPALDTLAAILRRKLTGRSIYAADRGHLHHRMMAALGSNQKALAVVAVCCTLTCVAGLLSVFEKDDRIALVTFIGIFVVLVTTGLFGRTEMMLIWSQISGSVSTFRQPWNFTPTRNPRRTTFRSPAAERWSSLWEKLIARGIELKLGKMRLDLDFPSNDEEFHASWQRASADELELCWRLDVPLRSGHNAVGRLSLAGASGHPMIARDIDRMLEVVTLFDPHLVDEQVPVVTQCGCMTANAEDVEDVGDGRDEYAEVSALVKSHPK